MIPLPPREKRKPKEIDVQAAIVSAVGRLPGVRVVRNNVGTIEDSRGIPVTFGLGEGSPDLVGVITLGGPESAIRELAHLEPIALAFGIEVKQPGRYATRTQRGWHHVARRRGMPVGVARSPDDAVAFVTELLVEHRARLGALVGGGA